MFWVQNFSTWVRVKVLVWKVTRIGEKLLLKTLSQVLNNETIFLSTRLRVTSESTWT